MVKLAGDGLTMRSTPARPVIIARTRRHPTVSPRNSVAKAITNKGTACMTAVSLVMVSHAVKLAMARIMIRPALNAPEAVETAVIDMEGPCACLDQNQSGGK